MARTANPDKPKLVTIGASVPAEVVEAIEEYRWSPEVRQTQREFVAQAVQEKVEALGLDLAAAKARLATPAEATPKS